MRHAKTCLLLLAAALLIVPAIDALAATPGSMPTFPPAGKPPLAPPPITELSRAYEFRTRLSGDPSCQHFATEADAVFLDGQADEQSKIARLKALEAGARVSGCLTPSPAGY